MRVALIPLLTQPKEPEANWAHFTPIAEELAATHGPLDFIGLPECAFTGYLYTPEDLEHFAEPIPGPTTRRIAALAKHLHAAIGFGMVERAAAGIFNTAVLVNDQGKIALVQRKISERPPYAPGQHLLSATISNRTLAILTCGDLFSAAAIQKIPREADLLFVPMARGFDKKSPDAERWAREERKAYQEAVQRIGLPALIVNALDVGVPEGAFGGSMIIAADGTLLAESPHGSNAPLVYTL
jgi:predicted amidohydrolase